MSPEGIPASATFEFRHLRYFLAVAEEQSFSQAALRLHVGQPAVSRRVQDLEAVLGIPLFDRTARGVVLTAAGKSFMKDAREIVYMASATLQRMQRAAKGDVLHLRVGVSDNALDQPIVSGVLQRHRNQHPEVQLTLKMLSTHEQILALKAGELDAGFLYGVPAAGHRQAHLAIHEHPIGLVLSVRHPLASLPVIRLADLADQEFLLFPRRVSEAVHDALMAKCRAGGLVPRLGQEVSDSGRVMHLAALGFGVGFMLMPPADQPSAHTPGVVIRPIADLDFGVMLNLAWRHDNESRTLLGFVNTLRARLAGEEEGLASTAPLGI